MITIGSIVGIVRDRLAEDGAKHVVHVPTERKHVLIVDHGHGRKTMITIVEEDVAGSVTWSRRGNALMDGDF